MKTLIDLDDDLVRRALALAGGDLSKKALVGLALKEFVESRERRDLRELKGKIRFAPGHDFKAARVRPEA